MKKLYIIFIVLFTTDAFALYNTNIPNACGTYPKIRAVFIPNEHTCQSGYFLPANVDGCRPCPTDHVCSGGTFAFNEHQSQGIKYKTLTRNSANSCASNISHKLVAKFTPNTVTLNFDDDNGNTTSGSCTYDGLVNLPPTPTREGYDFVGWKLVTNE